MRPYFELIRNSYKAQLEYKVSTILNLVYSCLTFFVQICIWKALYATNEDKLISMGQMDFRDMLTYLIISAIIDIIIGTNVIYELNAKVRTGKLAVDLIKPLNFNLMVFCESIGKSSFKLIFQMIPLLIVVQLIMPINIPSVHTCLLFFVFSINAVILHFVLRYIFGILAFWYESVWQFDMLLDYAIRLFSGMFIPLWFFPDVLRQLCKFLPFEYMYYIPISVYLNKITGVGLLKSLANQIAFILILLVIAALLWNKAKKRLIVQGG